MMCLGMLLFRSNLFGISELPGLVCLFPSPDWRSYLSLFFSNKFSTSCSSSSLFGAPMIWILEHLKLCQRFLSLSSFSEFLFLHSLLVECLFIPSGPNHWFGSRSPSHHCWFSVHFPLFTFHSLHFFLYFWTILNHFCEHPDYQYFELCI